VDSRKRVFKKLQKDSSLEIYFVLTGLTLLGNMHLVIIETLAFAIEL